MFQLDFFTFTILVLGVYRVTSLLVLEEGPFNVFGLLRDFAGVNNKDYSEKVPFFGEVLSCFGCTSIWVAAATGLLVVLFPVVVMFISAILALSAAAMLLNSE